MKTTQQPRRSRFTDSRIVLAVACLVLVAATGTVTARTIIGRTINVSGVLVDARTNKPLGGAQISAPEISQKTKPNGTFAITDVPRGTELRFGARNYDKSRTMASADPLRVKLRPIPVNGTVKSSFTGKPIGATVQGKEADRTDAKGAFTIYGVGPGDTLKITAFGHAPASVKIGPKRTVNASLKLGRVDPIALLRSVGGYGYVNAPPELVQMMRDEIAYYDPAINQQITGIAAKSIIKDSESVGIAIAVAIDPAIAALPVTRQGFMQGFSMGLPSSKEIKIGDVRVRQASGDGVIGYAWQQYAGFVTVIGESKATIEPFVRGLILGRTISA